MSRVGDAGMELGWTGECDGDGGGGRGQGREGSEGRGREQSGGGRRGVMGMVAGGGGGKGGRGGWPGAELGWTGECDGDGGGGRRSWRHMKGLTCTPRGLGAKFMGLESTDQCGKTLANDILGSGPAISSNERSVYFAQNLRVSGVTRARTRGSG